MEKTKICTKCGNEFPAATEYFYKANDKHDGLQNICKQCNKIYYSIGRKKYYENNKDYKKEYQKEYYDNNKTDRLNYSKEYRDNNKDVISERGKKYRKTNEDYYKNYNKKYREENKEAISKRYKDYYIQNKDERLSYAKNYRETEMDKDKTREYNLKYRIDNAEKMRENRTAYVRSRRLRDFKYKLNETVSCSIYQSLQGNKKLKKWESLVGYKLNDLIEHLEKQFEQGLTWENHSRYGWHIDHKRPIDSFNFTSSDEEEFKQCWSLDNLQPLWALDNLSKGNKW